MRTGQLRKRIQIQADRGTDSGAAGDGIMEHEPRWVTVASCWASVKNLSGRKGLRADEIVNEANYEVTLRYNRDQPITPANRIVLNDRMFEILQINNVDERNRELVLIVREFVKV